MKTMRDYRVRTISDIVNALKRDPEWLKEVRKLVLTEQLLNLPKRFDEFIKNEFRPLVRRVDRMEEDVAALRKDVAELKNDMEKLKKIVKGLQDDVGSLKGDNFERKVRERAPSYFGRILRRIKTIDYDTLGNILDEAIDKGIITEDEKMELLRIDGVLKGKRPKDGQEMWLVFEASCVVNKEDVERAKRRAIILKRAIGKPVVAVVIGEKHAVSEEYADEQGVIML